MAYLDQLRALGVPELVIGGERDAWILVAAQMPEHMTTFMALKSQQLQEPATRDMVRDLAAIIEWQPDDPRLPAVADRLVALYEAVDLADQEKWAEFELPDSLVNLLDEVFLDSVPIAGRLLELLEDRGWTGWTRVERVVSASAK